MDISNLFESVNCQIKPDDLKPVTKKLYESVIKNSQITFDEIKTYLENISLSIDNLYYLQNEIRCFWYIDNHAFVEIMITDKNFKEYFEFMKIKECIKVRNEKLGEAWDHGDFMKYYSLMLMAEPQFVLFHFIKHADLIPEDKLYKVFIMLYTYIDYGFKDIPKELMKKILKSNKDRSFEEYLITDDDGYATIYRGIASKSTEIKDAYSWTTNIGTAAMFATRFETVAPKIYKAKIHTSKIADYIPEPEAEILVLPEDVVDVERVAMYTIEKIQNKKDFSIYLKFWYYIKEKIEAIKELYADEPHDINHTKRVCYLSIVLSYLYKLPLDDIMILLNSGMLHDIGRLCNDESMQGEDEFHGERSVSIIKEKRIQLKEISIEDQEIIKTLIIYHCKDDKVGIEFIIKNNIIKDKDRAIKLYNIFKDCDALDRVRIKDLDIKYLRCEESRKLPLLTYQALRCID